MAFHCKVRGEMCKADTFSGNFRKESVWKLKILKAACYCKSWNLPIYISTPGRCACLCSKNMFWDIPGGPLVENPLPNAGDTGSIPSLGRSHMPWSNWAQAPQLLSTCSRVPELQLLKPVCLEPALCNIGNHRSKKSTHHNEKQPLLLQLAKAHAQQRRSSAAKIKYINIFFF